MKKLRTILASISMGVLVFAGAVPALSALAISTNGSFENGTDPGVFTTLTPGSTNITDWSVVSGSVDYIGTYWQAADGTRSIDMSGDQAGTIKQTLNTLNGHIYKVSFAMAGNPDGAPIIKTMTASAGGVTPSFNFSTAGFTKANMGYETKSFNFTANSTTTDLVFASTTAGFFGPALDNVVVEDLTPVPAACDQNIAYNVILGTNASETLNGTSGPDLILAYGGNDTIGGGIGNDCISGGSGDDTINGGINDDVILGGTGNDTISGSNNNDAIYGEGGNDTLSGGNDNDTVDGGTGTDSANGGTGIDSCSAETMTNCAP